MNEVLIEMLKIYQPDGRCWMNYELSKKNNYTFHHIKEVRNGGLYVIENGAILTRDAHTYLNYLSRNDYIIYKKLNQLFQRLNNTRKPPTFLYYEELDDIMKKVRK